MKKGSLASNTPKTVGITLSVRDTIGNLGNVLVNHSLIVNDDVGPVISGVSAPAQILAYTSNNRAASATVNYSVNDATHGSNVTPGNVNIEVRGSLPANVTCTPNNTLKSGTSCTTVVPITSLNGHNVVKTVDLRIVATDPDGNSSHHDFSVDIKVIDNVKPTVTVDTPASDIILSNVPGQTSDTATAKFLINDDMTASNDLSVTSLTSGANLSHSNGVVTLSKTYNYNATNDPSGQKELGIRVTDGAGNFIEESVQFTVTQNVHDLVAPVISNVSSDYASNEVVFHTNNPSHKTIKITATITDPAGDGSKGIDWKRIIVWEQW